MNASDPELLSRIAHGEIAAFSEFYDRHGGRLFAALLKLVTERRDAEELLQETFWHVWTHADEHASDGKSSPVTRLLLLIRSRAEDQFRRRRSQASSFDNGDRTSAQDSANDVEGLNLAPQAREILEMLSEEHVRVTGLAFYNSLTPVMPRAAVRGILMKRIAAEAANGSSLRQRPTSAVFIERGRKADWTSTGIPGARTRTLFIDRDRHLHTFLMRLDPGCRIRVSEHAAMEQCLVLEGDLHAYDTVLQAGDYLRAPSSSSPDESYTAGGCLLLVISGVSSETK